MESPPAYGAPPPPQPGFNVQPNAQPNFNVQPNVQPNAQPVYVDPVVTQPLNSNPYGYQPVPQPHINALSATPRAYSSPWGEYQSCTRITVYSLIAFFATLLVFTIVFVIIFFTK